MAYRGICRLCSERVDSTGGDGRNGTNYAVRHVAHYTCMVDRWGEKIFDRFRPGRILDLFPWRLLKNAGLDQRALRDEEQLRS